MSQEHSSSKQHLIRYGNRQRMSWRAVDVEKLIGEDHTARAIWELVGRLDLRAFYQAIENSAEEGGRPAFDPHLLISLWVYAYSQGIGSAREVARRCEYDPAFQWLTGLEEVNYHTLADFRVEKQKELDELFTQVLAALSKEGLITLDELQKLQECKSGEKAKSETRVSTSDPQARVMKQSDGGLALSYNAQISTDAAHGLIVGVAVTQEAEDSAQLMPAVDRIEERLEKKPQQMVTDGGYTTRDNIEKMAGQEIDFLGSMGREEMQSGATAPNRLPPSAFVYDHERNLYVCPEGKLLRSQGRFKKKKLRGLMAYRYEAKASDCAACVRRSECCPENQSRGRGLLRRVENAAIVAFREKMASPEAQAQYRLRGRVVEFCHAWIKSKLGLRQFHVRGTLKVATELLWACLTYNLQHWIRLGVFRGEPESG